MEFLNKYNLTARKVVKVICVALGAIVVLVLVTSIVNIKLPFNVSRIGDFGDAMSGIPAYDKTQNSYSENGVYVGGAEKVKLSTRNVSSIVPSRPVAVGNDAESYEVTDYNAQVETRYASKICGQILKLKAFDYVIFENANESKRQCNYTFKVEHSRVPEILTAIRKLNPKELAKNTYTIKHQIDDFTSEMDILEK
ncbi:MAG: hypothetical protein WCT19_04440, partial [Candidatus Paceibacterota bacterium]